MEIFGIELRKTDWPRLVAWYRDVIRLRSVVRMTSEKYALLSGNRAGTLAILGRTDAGPASPRWNLVLEVDDLDGLYARLVAGGTKCSSPKLHPEGYREILTSDPDGNQVRCFAWDRKK